MDLTILIPVRNDVHIKECVESIDEKVDILVVLNNPTREVEDIVSKLDVKVAKIGEANLSKAYNYGIENAKYENVLLMDSDCTFQKGCIKKLYDGLNTAKLSKGKVVFKRNSKVSNVIAKVREFTTSDFCNAYSPPLAFKKKIVNDIGYYFDPNLRWEEDYDFNNRVIKAGLTINWIKDAEIYHPELTLFRDLRSAFNYGTGHYVGIKKGIYKEKELTKIQRKKLISYQMKYIYMKKGYAALLYYKVWCKAYKFGMIAQRYFIRNGLNINE